MNDSSANILTVSELNRLARLAVERGLPSCWVKGELSNLTRAASGHWYFSIKDAGASARCVMFRARNQFVDWQPREGEQIEMRAQASIYEARGDFQLIVDAMRKAGRGNLFEALMRLKEKLQQEGLFDPQRKRALPRLPRCIGVITSPRGAALHDVLTTLAARWPSARVIVYPCQVQGDGAPAQIISALDQAEQRAEADVLLLVRGGGSIEDLWAFNDERLARRIAISGIPVVSGVGHETDFCIADFVADQRAPTPTGAAQMATPDARELLQGILMQRRQLSRDIGARIDAAWQRHDHVHRRLRHPMEHIREQQRHHNHLTQRLALAGSRQCIEGEHLLSKLRQRLISRKPMPGAALERVNALRQHMRRSLQQQLQTRSERMRHLGEQLHLLCPQQVLKRGYGIVRDETGCIIVSSRQAHSGQRIEIELATGRLGAEVTRVEE